MSNHGCRDSHASKPDPSNRLISVISRMLSQWVVLLCFSNGREQNCEPSAMRKCHCQTWCSTVSRSLPELFCSNTGCSRSRRLHVRNAVVLSACIDAVSPLQNEWLPEQFSSLFPRCTWAHTCQLRTTASTALLPPRRDVVLSCVTNGTSTVSSTHTEGTRTRNLVRLPMEGSSKRAAEPATELQPQWWRPKVCIPTMSADAPDCEKCRS